MSDTPRTREETRWYESGIVHACFAAQLERELNAANERINQLKEALEAIRDHADDEWRKAKESKP